MTTTITNADDLLASYQAGERDFREANLIDANLSGANLSGANLSRANLIDADLSGADLIDANLSGANLSRADLIDANLSGAYLIDADLSGADLSRAKNLLDPVAWLKEHLDHDEQGILVYKTFGSNRIPPEHWKIEPGATLSEVVNPLPTNDCACGINVATLSWIRANGGNGPIWLGRVRWEWLIGAVIPYHTDGKFRVSRLELLEVVQ